MWWCPCIECGDGVAKWSTGVVRRVFLAVPCGYVNNDFEYDNPDVFSPVDDDFQIDGGFGKKREELVLFLWRVERTMRNRINFE